MAMSAFLSHIFDDWGNYPLKECSDKLKQKGLSLIRELVSNEAIKSHYKEYGFTYNDDDFGNNLAIENLSPIYILNVFQMVFLLVSREWDSIIKYIDDKDKTDYIELFGIDETKTNIDDDISFLLNVLFYNKYTIFSDKKISFYNHDYKLAAKEYKLDPTLTVTLNIFDEWEFVEKQLKKAIERKKQLFKDENQLLYNFLSKDFHKSIDGKRTRSSATDAKIWFECLQVYELKKGGATESEIIKQVYDCDKNDMSYPSCKTKVSTRKKEAEKQLKAALKNKFPSP